ncbi:MocR-like pyridoxine biosynthesis transcription factor PdxR [Lysinibacillus capsici]|uniref:MocR-like pyridoxine biosynthesis transcription factor PdxR n=1 Tax=Lysinibacillus capsici TaxID=2115968 RepID=UPI002152E632|nr:PLP-dependent aminotransferase family protein [Lysinibacillus capsici]MCR6522128.1 PLP-dependent aminotransferase family protein [Lysinibacillus capsici]
MNIEIQRNIKVSLSKQIYLSIIDHIRSGLLEEGTQLPSVRDLSKHIGVSLVTTVKAYQKLEEDGFVSSIQGKGTFINTECKGIVRDSPTGNLDWQLSVQDYLPRSQVAQFHHVPERINLSSSIIDPGLLPNRYLESEANRIFSENPRIMSQYGEVQGDIALRTEICNYLQKTEVPTTPENILVTNGSQQGIDLIARTFIGPGDVVIMEAPTYPGAIDVFRGRGAVILTVPIDDEGMQVDKLQSLCDKYKPKIIYTIPTYHNPTGVIMSVKRRKEILNIAQSFQSLIIEDDPHSEIYFNRKPPSSLKSMDEYGHVIYVKGLSKTLSPGCRIGVLIASGSIFKRLLAAKANVDLGSPLITQKVILPFIQSYRMNDHVKKLRTALKIRRDLVVDLLSEYAPSDTSWKVPEGGLNLWVTLPSWVNINHLLIEAKKRKVTFLPGFACYPMEYENNHIRISYSYMNEPLLREGIITLCDIMHSNNSLKSDHNHSLYF